MLGRVAISSVEPPFSSVGALITVASGFSRASGQSRGSLGRWRESHQPPPTDPRTKVSLHGARAAAVPRPAAASHRLRCAASPSWHRAENSVKPSRASSPASPRAYGASGPIIRTRYRTSMFRCPLRSSERTASRRSPLDYADTPGPGTPTRQHEPNRYRHNNGVGVMSFMPDIGIKST
jgi:hypothetical protein